MSGYFNRDYDGRGGPRYVSNFSRRGDRNDNRRRPLASYSSVANISPVRRSEGQRRALEDRKDQPPQDEKESKESKVLADEFARLKRDVTIAKDNFKDLKKEYEKLDALYRKEKKHSTKVGIEVEKLKLKCTQLRARSEMLLHEPNITVPSEVDAVITAAELRKLTSTHALALEAVTGELATAKTENDQLSEYQGKLDEEVTQLRQMAKTQEQNEAQTAVRHHLHISNLQKAVSRSLDSEQKAIAQKARVEELLSRETVVKDDARRKTAVYRQMIRDYIDLVKEVRLSGLQLLAVAQSHSIVNKEELETYEHVFKDHHASDEPGITSFEDSFCQAVSARVLMFSSPERDPEDVEILDLFDE